MGDDLIFAQKFTRTAADGLALLAEMENPRAANESAVVIDMMTTVQRGAKRLRARHIYSGAQGVLSALHHDTDTVLAGRIVNLGSLVTEYARGLDDLLHAQNRGPKATPLDKWDMARDTLNALLPTASSDDADVLSRLMRAPVDLEAVRSDLDIVSGDADIIPFVKSGASMADDVPSLDTFSIPEISPAEKATAHNAPQFNAGPSITLDAMMRDVIADALSVARTVGRTISVSYDMGDRTVLTERAEDLRGRMGLALAQIIRQSMTEDRVGHIDINLAGEQLHIMAGTTAIRVAIDLHNTAHQATPESKSLITDETEPGLRAQLHALMDPITLQETAS